MYVPRTLFLFALACAPAFACSVDTAPRGLRATPPGTGPLVVFDLQRRPLPEIPFPNDIATVADSTSRTGRRINASLMSPTHMERTARAGFDELEGWGTFAPLAVSFSREAKADAGQPAIDLDELHRRMGGSTWDTTDDAVYVVNLTTGVPVLLDLDSGSFPLTVVDQGQYYANDTRGAEQNILFESAEEGAGLTQADYRPSLDTDFDGVLDHPNTFGPMGKWRGVDNLMTWYERETDTLVLRPMVPMEQMTEYAIVLTDRLRGSAGQPVRSPFPYVHHAMQRTGVAKLQSILSDKTRANYYGDLAGSGLDHVAFAWTFTTQPIVEDLLLLRDGLYGKGPFARFAAEYPAKLTLHPAAGLSLADADEPAGWQAKPECASTSKTPFAAHWVDAKDAIGPFFEKVFTLSPTSLKQLKDTLLEHVDYFVVGTFEVPNLQGDPKSNDPDQHFHANFMTGEASVYRDKVHFWLSVPKSRGDRKPPFPVAYWEHGTTVHDTEMFIHAGNYARSGVALVSTDAPGHGLVLAQGEKFLLQALMAGACLAPFSEAIGSGRAIDLNGDGIPDDGGLIWSAHVLHTRDGVRQGALEGVQLTRIFRAFDGALLADQDYDGDGKPNLAGDFNGDGVVDVGGPSNRYFSSGGSLGGILAQVHGGIDPYITATAPVSGAGGFVDVNLRGKVTPVPVLEQALGPLVLGVPASRVDKASSHCTGTQRSVRWLVNDLFDTREVEIACLEANELDVAMTVVVENTTSRERRCARTSIDGAFRVPLPTSVGDGVAIQIFTSPDQVVSYKGCEVLPGAPVGRRVDTWEQAAVAFTPVATEGLTCDAAAGCQQFREHFYPIGSALVAPQEGIGLSRQTPEFRKLMNLSQAALDSADPINYAPYFMLKTLRGIDGAPTPPRPIFDVHTAGDDQVLVSAGNAFARAAGALPFLPPSAATTMPEYADYATPPDLYQALNGRTPNQVMIDAHVTEGLSRLARTPGNACGVNWKASTECGAKPTSSASTCEETLYDADWLGESQQDYGQNHPATPLRLARLATVRANDAASLSKGWAPRLQGKPMGTDMAWPGGAPLVGTVVAYIKPLGQHDWATGEPCQSFDSVTYMDNLVAHYFASSGQDIYYVTHPGTHACLADSSCPFFK